MNTNGKSGRGAATGIGTRSTGWMLRRGFGLEALEPRCLLSTVDLAAQLKEQGPQDPGPQALLGDQWIVTLNDPSFAAELRRTLGARSMQSVSLLSNTFVVNMPTGYDPGALQTQLQNLAQVSQAYPLLARTMETRFASNDPLFANQWHLSNTGQTGGTVGADANILPVWGDRDITGAGVVIGIVDDGLQFTHPDLAPNYDAALSFDYYDNDPNPSPTLPGDGHGTSVAGVAAGRGGNAFGVSGAAPQATLAGLRLIVGPITDLQTAGALTHQLQEIDIYNNSWGPTPGTLFPRTELEEQALIEGVTTGRGGLGAIYVFAAGNGLQSLNNSNYDAFANSRYTIAVSAIDDRGGQSYYSEPGANILVAGYSNSIYSGITTTDLVGANGYDPTSFTDEFGGTSSAAPLVSGVIALMLDANPNLTWRDVQHILVNTSERNDAADEDWAQNGSGRWVNHKYGFGAIDAAAAVTAALNWTTVDVEQSITSPATTVSAILGDNDGSSYSSSILITEDLNIESVEIVFDAQTTYRGDLRVVLTSPDGTQSILAEPHPDSGDNYEAWVFSSVRHWGESSAGTWTLTVSDELNADIATWNSWRLNFYGTESNAGRISGTKFNDEDRDGVQDEGEEGLAGWTIFVDNDLDGTLDPGERFAVTDQDGSYTIRGLEAVTMGEDDPYRVREVAQAGWASSLPAQGYYEVFVGEGALVEDIDFGNYQITPDIQVQRVVDGGMDVEVFDDISVQDLGTYVRGQVATAVTYRITNVGPDPLVLGAVSVPAGFTLLNVANNDFAGLSLANNESVTFGLLLDTSSQGSRSGSLSIVTNDAGENPFNFVVAGTVTALPAIITVLDEQDAALTDGQLGVIDLTPIDPAVEGGAGPTYTFTVRNDGDIVLGLGTVATPAGFSVVEPLATSLAAGESDTFTLQLNTTTAGTFSGNVTIANTDTNNPDDDQPHPFTFSVTGTVSSLTREIHVFNGNTELSNGQLGVINFGSTLEGAGTLTLSFTVRNDGEGDLVLQTPALPAGFTLAEPLATRLMSGQSDTFTVRLDHAVPGNKAGNIVIVNNDPDSSPFSFPVSGTVTPRPEPDLTPVFTEPQLTSGLAFLPGDILAMPVNLSNIGTLVGRGPVTVKAYLSSDNTLSLDDVLVSEIVDQNVEVLAGAGRVLDLGFRVPRDLTPGDYFVIVDTSGDLQTADGNPANDTVASSDAIPVRWWFGEFNGRATDFTADDFAGTPIIFRMDGGGYGEIDGPGLNQITFRQTGRNSRAVIRVDPLEGGQATVRGLSVLGEMKAVELYDVDVDGNVNVQGKLARLVADDFLPGSAINVNGTSGGNKFRLIADSLVDTDLTSGLEVDATVNQWLSSDSDNPAAIRAPKLGKLLVRQDMTAVITLTSSRGQVSAKSIVVGGTLSNSSIRGPGGLQTVDVGRSVANTIFAGVGNLVVDQPDDIADFINNKARIKNFIVRGLNPIAEPSFQDTLVAAWRIGKASLVQVQGDNDGSPFGVTAAFVDEISRKTNSGTVSFKKLGFIELLHDQDQDYRLLIVA